MVDNVQRAGPPGNQAVDNAGLAADEIGLNEAQLAKKRADESSQKQMQLITNALLQGLGVKNPQNVNPRHGAGFAARVRPVEARGKLGIEHPSAALIKGEQQLQRMFAMQSEMSEQDNALTQTFSQMDWKQRQDYLKSFDLDRYSLYDPLPDATAVYQVNLLVARNLTERMYQF